MDLKSLKVLLDKKVLLVHKEGKVLLDQLDLKVLKVL